MNAPKVKGHVAPEFAAVADRLAVIAAADEGFGGQLAITHRGELVVDLQVSDHVHADSLYPVFSATKGAAAMVIAQLVDKGMLDVDTAVVHYWPEFGAEGKADVLVRELLSHQAGLVSAPGLTAAEIVASVPAAERLARARPWWRPGAAVGYHGLTIGVFMEELVRRITGASLQHIYEESVRGPRQIDVHLGLSDQLRARHVKARYPAVPAPPADVEPPLGDDLAAWAFMSIHRPFLLNEGEFDPFSPAVRNSGFAAGGAAASARGLAKLYAAAVGEGAEPLVQPETLTRMTQLQVLGQDLVTGTVSAFGVVFGRPHLGYPFGSHRAFGHDGAGGVVAFADPLYQLSFGFIPDPMTLTPDRSLELSATARRCALDRC